MQAADMQSRAGAESVKRGAKQLEQQTVALKRILHKVKPFLRSESVNTDAALAIRNKIGVARRLLAPDTDSEQLHEQPGVVLDGAPASTSSRF